MKLQLLRSAQHAVLLATFVQRPRQNLCLHQLGISANFLAILSLYHAFRGRFRDTTLSPAPQIAISVPAGMLASRKVPATHYHVIRGLGVRSTAAYRVNSAQKAAGTHTMPTLSRLYVYHALPAEYVLSRAWLMRLSKATLVLRDLPVAQTRLPARSSPPRARLAYGATKKQNRGTLIALLGLLCRNRDPGSSP